MRRIDLLRKHVKTDRDHINHARGRSDPRIAENPDGSWHLYYLGFPPVEDHVWFVCSPNGRPFPRSCAYDRSGAISMFLLTLNLPAHTHNPKTGEGWCHHVDEPERSKWWSWFKNQGYNIQRFSINPQHEVRGLAEFLRYELRWANKRTGGCVWCTSVKRFQNIASRLALMVEAIDYYSERPEEQKRWLTTMNKLWRAKKGGSRADER